MAFNLAEIPGFSVVSIHNIIYRYIHSIFISREKKGECNNGKLGILLFNKYSSPGLKRGIK